MKPLQSIAMGWVVIVLSARVDGYDALPDPVGWLLVGLGLAGLPERLPHRGGLQRLGVLAGLVAVLVWFPALTDALHDADASLAWAVNLPQLLFSVLLCHALAARAARHGDLGAARRLRTARAALVAVGLLPVLVFGAGLESLEVASYLAATVAALLLIWLLFCYAARPWTRPVAEASPAPTAAP